MPNKKISQFTQINNPNGYDVVLGFASGETVIYSVSGLSESSAQELTITGVTFNNNNLILNNNTGGTISTIINNFTGISVNGSVSATTFLGLNTTTGGTYSNGVITLVGSGNLSPITGLTFSGFDTKITGATFSNDTLTLTNNTGETVTTTINRFNSLSANTISGVTFYGKGSNLTGISGTTHIFSRMVLTDSSATTWNYAITPYAEWTIGGNNTL